MAEGRQDQRTNHEAAGRPEVDAALLWVLTDGRAGNENPALGLAAATAARLATAGRPMRLEVKRIGLRPGAAMLPPRLWSLPGARWGGWPFTALEDRGAALAPPWPALVIGAGRRAAPVAAALRRLGGGRLRAAQILDPRMPPELFDLVIAPAHDGLSGPRVLATAGSLHRIDAAALATRDSRLAALPRPLLSVLIGGGGKSARFTPADAEALLAALAVAAEQGAGLAATASRRTPAAVRALLAERIAGLGGFFWDETPPNPYFALLGGADAIIVTADSVNMASEACAAGKPVYVAPLSRISAKLGRFHAAMASAGHTRPLPPRLTPETLASWRPAPLDDMARAAKRTAALLPSA